MKSSTLHIPGLENVEKLISTHSYERALAVIFDICCQLVAAPELRMNGVHVPELDKLIQRIGENLSYRTHSPDEPKDNSNGNGLNLIIATEIYKTGGHTRVVEDLARHLSGPTLLVLTDIFGTYCTGNLELASFHDRTRHFSTVVLPKSSLVDGIDRLTSLIFDLRPNRIFLAAHHQDVVAYASCNRHIRIPQIFIHHADHNPTLGATVPHYRHVDLHPAIMAMCKNAGVQRPFYLPLTSHKTFEFTLAENWATATSGSFEKFAFEGPYSYLKIAATILSATGRDHYHFGPIPDPARSAIEAHLRSLSIDPVRFRHVPYVESLAEALRRHPVGIYITSAPITGLKALIEATAANVPVLAFLNTSSGNTVDQYLYHTRAPELEAWHTVEELPAKLTGLDLLASSARSRAYFQKYHSGTMFAKCLKDVCAAG